MIFLEKKLKSDWIKQGGIFSILTFFLPFFSVTEFESDWPAAQNLS